MNAVMNVLNAFFNPVIWGTAVCIALIVGIIEWYRTRNEYLISKSEFKWVLRAIHRSENGLTSGGTGDYYFDIDSIGTTVEDLMKLSGWYVKIIIPMLRKNSVNYLAFIEKDSGPVGAITLLSQLVLETKTAAIIIRLRKRMQSAKIVGKESLVNKQVILVTDVITTGRTVVDAIKAIEKKQGNVVGICALFDRREKANEPLNGIPVSIVTSENALKDMNLLESV
jgi:orotate phosphoribosyltransferase